MDQLNQNHIYHFSNPKQELMFLKLTHSIRCAVCQNQSIADSEAGLAVDLRNEVYQQVRSNKTETEVLAFMTERYGDSILYQPPFHMGTAVLWLGPLFLMFLGIWVFTKHVNLKSETKTKTKSKTISQKNEAKIN